jgi:hypothetical protein
MTTDRFSAYQRGEKVADVDGVRLDDRYLYLDGLTVTETFLLDQPFEFRHKFYRVNASSMPRRQGKILTYTSVCAIDLSCL